MTSAPVTVTDSTDLLARYTTVRGNTERLSAPLGPEDQVIQSMTDCSPTKWHRGHTTWFFEEFILSATPGYEPVDPTYRFLFNSYYEAVGPRQPRPRRGMITRPSVDDVAEFRRRIDERIARVIASTADPAVVALIELGTHHEQQHQELLLMDIKNAFWQNPYLPGYQITTDATAGADAPGPVQWLAFDGGLAEIGHEGAGFAYDNEGPRHRVWLEPFRIADRLVTCGEWLEFMADDGYRRPELWLSDGWATVQGEGWQAPLYWHDTEGGGDRQWRVFTLTGDHPIDPAAPVVNVSYYEADAFARWSGCRLPTEAEWEVAAVGVPTAHEPALHPRPRSGHGLTQMYGEVWQWTASSYSPYPGFRIADGAVGEYNGKFMIDQQVLRGSASITPADHTRPTYRNFFPTSARWAFSGLRLAADAR